MISQKSEVLNQFFVKELMALIKRYNELEESLVRKIETIIQCVQTQETDHSYFSTLEEIIQLAETIGDEVDEDLVRFYFAVRQEIVEISIEEASILWDRLCWDGHTKISSEDVVIYSDERNLREYVENRVDNIVRDSYEIDRLFDKDTIIDYLIDGTSLEEIASELINNVDDYEEILELDAEYLFQDSQGTRYRYGMLHG